MTGPDTSAAAGTAVARIAGVAVTSDGWPVRFAVVTVIDMSGRQIGGGAAAADGTFASMSPKCPAR